MNDQDINQIVAKLTKSLATKDDFLILKEDIHRLEDKISDLDIKISHLDKGLSDLDKKSDLILEFAQAVDEEVDSHGKRLTKIENHLGLTTTPNS